MSSIIESGNSKFKLLNKSTASDVLVDVIEEELVRTEAVLLPELGKKAALSTEGLAKYSSYVEKGNKAQKECNEVKEEYGGAGKP